MMAKIRKQKPVARKVTAGAAAGAVVTVLVWAVGLLGLVVPGEVGAALSTIAAFAAGYLRSE